MSTLQEAQLHIGPRAHTVGGREYNTIQGFAMPKISRLPIHEGIYAQANMGGANVTTQPTFFYSPELTPETWLLPKGRVETLKWCTLHFNLNPYIHSIINMHAKYPFSNFKLRYKDAQIEKQYNSLVFRNKHFDWYEFILQMSLSYWKYGEACVWGDWDAAEKTWNYLTLLPPSEIDYREDTFSGEISIEMIPTTTIKNKVRDALLQGRLDIDPILVDAVQNNRKIPLDTKGTEGNIFTGEDYSPPKAFVWARVQEPGEVRGTSIIQCLFKDLIFADKVRLAQMAIADRHFLPIEHWTVGHWGGTEESSMLPGNEMLEDMRAMITQATQQPPFTIVAGPYLKYEALGVSGKLLSIYDDLGYVENQILVGLGVNKNLILSEGPSFCQTEDTRVLTQTGLKYYWELQKDELIATFNPETEEMEWHAPQAIHVFDHDGDMIHFKSAHIDHCVTPNHKVWVKPARHYKTKKEQSWQQMEARDTIAKGLRFRTSTKWTGTPVASVICDGISIPIDIYCKLLGYYASEGWAIKNWNGTKHNGIGIGQSLISDCYQDIRYLMEELQSLGVSVKYTESDATKYYKKSKRPAGYHKQGVWTIRTKNPELVKHLVEDCGVHSQNKQLPIWAKQLPKEQLTLILEALLLGDGSWHKPSGLRNKDVGYNTYITTSPRLASDVAEIAMKLGYRPKINSKADKDAPKTNKQIFTVNFSDKKYATASIEGNEGKVRWGGTKGVTHYKGKVWCPEVGPHHLFISERNGKFVVTGNSSGKTIALHRLIREYTTVRELLSNWIKINLLLPIAKANNIIDEGGEYILPEIVWELSLTPEKDKENFDIAYKMWKDGILSTESLYEKCPFTLDYKLEMERLQSERGTIFDKGDKRLGKKIQRGAGAGGAGGAGSPDAALGGGAGGAGAGDKGNDELVDFALGGGGAGEAMTQDTTMPESGAGDAGAAPDSGADAAA